MRTSQLENRIEKLESIVNESVKGNAKDEVRDELISWLELDPNGKRRLMGLRKQIMNDTKQGPFVDLVEDIVLNDSDALAFYGKGVDDNLYYSDELDVDVLDIIDELLNL